MLILKPFSRIVNGSVGPYLSIVKVRLKLGMGMGPVSGILDITQGFPLGEKYGGHDVPHDDLIGGQLPNQGVIPKILCFVGFLSK